MKTNVIRMMPILLVAALAGCGKDGATSAAKTPAKAEANKAAVKEGEKGHGKEGEKPDDHAEAPVIKLTAEEMKSEGVRTEKASEQPLRARFTVSATIQPNRDRYAHVAPRIPGRILRVPAKAGDVVKAGQVLAELDSVELGEAQSAYLQAASSESLAKADFDRSDRLFKEQVVPEKDFLRARSEHEKARAAARAAADKLRMMGVSANRGAGSSSTLPVTASFAGTVIEKDAVIGELAQPDKPLFTIADLSTVWIEANLNERDLARVSKGAAAEIVVQAYPNDRFRGRVTYVSSVVDKESRTIKARIEVANPDGRLKPEMFATAHLEAEAVGKGYSVPSDAIVLLDGKKIVFIKEVDGFEVKEVVLGEEIGGRQVVKGGLSDGDEVVVAGVYALKARLLKSKIGSGHAH